MIFIGIDPGYDGYVAVLRDASSPNRDLISFYPAPIVEVPGAGKRRYDLALMTKLLSEIKCEMMKQPVAGYTETGGGLLVIERQQPFPAQGGISNFTTGYGFGAWEAAIVSARIPYETVHPKTWKKDLGLPSGGGKKNQKTIAIIKAQNLYPGIDFRPTEVKPGARVVSPDKCEAILIATYAKRLSGGKS